VDPVGREPKELPYFVSTKGTEALNGSAFFQSLEPEKCETSIKNAVVHFDFELPIETLSKGQRFYRTNLSISGSAMMCSLTLPGGDWREAWSPWMMTTVAV
jgi:hypothetical protein